jgi:alpha-amylase
MGFDAVWISPVVKNTARGYHGYWAQDLYDVNDHFGSSADLSAFVEAAHAKGLWVMVDVVANHVGNVDDAFDQISPFNSSAHYHPKCQIVDFTNQPQVEQCRLANLPDLNQVLHTPPLLTPRRTTTSSAPPSSPGCATSSPNMTSSPPPLLTAQFDGVRIDTVPEVHPDFWAEFNRAAVCAVCSVL